MIDESFSTILTSLNNPIRQLIQSNAPLDQVTFEDKTLLLHRGKYVVSIMIVSKPNIICNLISVNLSKTFEQRYFNENNQKEVSFRTENFNQYEKTLEIIGSYFL